MKIVMKKIIKLLDTGMRNETTVIVIDKKNNERNTIKKVRKNADK